MRSFLFLHAFLRLGTCSGLHAPTPGAFPSGGRSKPTAFERDGGVAYVAHFLSQADFGIVQRERSKMQKQLKPEQNAFATKRLCATVPRASPLSEIFSADRVVQRLNKLTGLELRPEGDAVPLELRLYGAGAFMEWHVDDCLLPGNQVEVVYTVDNDSDSKTQWLVQGAVVEEQTEPNSVVIIMANGPQHQVTPLRRGSRSIIKAVFSDRAALVDGAPADAPAAPPTAPRKGKRR
ncbi:hypothetical protein M885DRAFT_586670 [Pelagophyceae sp. CCMP2097]|nr:hypothetical protein M885DRAFT_586670 [Pelagophyceae sp. CCMP2097]